MTTKDVDRLVDEYMNKIAHTSSASPEDLEKVRDKIARAMRDLALVASHRGPDRDAGLAEQSDDFLDLPGVIADASGHRRGARVGVGEAHVGPREVVIHEVERHRSG